MRTDEELRRLYLIIEELAAEHPKALAPLGVVMWLWQRNVLTQDELDALECECTDRFSDEVERALALMRKRLDL
jgi:hypothetical protein